MCSMYATFQKAGKMAEGGRPAWRIELRRRTCTAKPKTKEKNYVNYRKEYIQRILDGPDADEFREKERKRQAEYRRRLKDDVKNGDEEAQQKVDRIRILSQERSRRYRIRRKKRGDEQKKGTVKTKKQRERLREYWRKKKRESRNRLKETQKLDVKICDRKSGVRIRVAAHRVRRFLPKSPKNFAECLDHIINNASPRKRTELDKRQLLKSNLRLKVSEMVQPIKDTLNTLKNTKKRTKYQLRANIIKGYINRNISLRANAKQLGLSWSYLQRIAKRNEISKTRSDALSEEQISEVKEFYRSPDVSVTLPDIKRVSKKHGVGHILNSSVQNCYNEYCKRQQEAGRPCVSKSPFQKLRPKNVKLHDSISNCVYNVPVVLGP